MSNDASKGYDAPWGRIACCFALTGTTGAVRYLSRDTWANAPNPDCWPGETPGLDLIGGLALTEDA